MRVNGLLIDDDGCWLYGTRRAVEKYAKLKRVELDPIEVGHPTYTGSILPDSVDGKALRLGQQVVLYYPASPERAKERIETISVLGKTQYRHEHDCTACVFLGQHGKFDMWVCPPTGTPAERRMRGSVIARDGEDGEYASTPLCMVGRILDQLNRDGHELIPYQQSMLIAVSRAVRLGIVAIHELVDGLTEVTITDLRRRFERDVAVDLPKFLCDF
jgi:hypothetical protein